MDTKLQEIRDLIDGYIDGAPDASPASRLANQIAMIIDLPARKLPASAPMTPAVEHKK
jgi:hypothetical protein